MGVGRKLGRERGVRMKRRGGSEREREREGGGWRKRVGEREVGKEGAMVEREM